MYQKKRNKNAERLIKSQEKALVSFKRTHNEDIVIGEEFNDNDNRDNIIEEQHCMVNGEISTNRDNELFSLDLIDPTNWEIWTQT